MAGRIRDEDIQAVRERTDIAKVVSGYLTLKKAGHDSLVGICPFHPEKTPSFSISPSKGARTSVYLASSPEVKGISGQYFTQSKRAAVKNKFDTAENRALLWDLSLNAAEEGAATAARRAS